MNTDARSADTFADITTSDATDLTKVNGMWPRGIYVGVAGDVVAVNTANTAVTFKNAAAGQIIPIKVRRVNSTSTTATNLVALY